MGFSLSRSAAPTAAIGATPAQTASKRKRAYRFTNIHIHGNLLATEDRQACEFWQGFASRRQRIAAKLTAGSGNDDTPGACRTGTGMSRLALVVAGFPASGKTLPAAQCPRRRPADLRQVLTASEGHPPGPFCRRPFAATRDRQPLRPLRMGGRPAQGRQLRPARSPDAPR